MILPAVDYMNCVDNDKTVTHTIHVGPQLQQQIFLFFIKKSPPFGNIYFEATMLVIS